MYDPNQFSEKYWLAWESALNEQPDSGICGYELEWNLLDSHLRPLLTVGTGPNRQSFVDYLRSDAINPWVKQFSQLEVFHWMIEWATRPYYSALGAVYEGRLLEAIQMNALLKAGKQFGERLYSWHGNLFFPTDISKDSIPFSWHLAKRRYLERCVGLYGSDLATAGTHTNLSIPEPLLAWDFMHLTPTDRGDMQFDEYKSQFYIMATRLLRAFAALFIATSASTPFQSQERNGRATVVLTENDSVRNIVFPNPEQIDLPDLYRSYSDYLQISYNLVRHGVRFGNNNWTPVRARSFAEPVERLILVTSDQLTDIYGHGLYASGQMVSVEEMAHQIEMQNLMARINIPMSRVEVRTDDGGNPLEVDVANLTLKHLLMLRCYADPDFARSFRYDREDIARARRNELSAAQTGLRGEIENPLTGKPIMMREFLQWTLNELKDLAKSLGLWDDLAPLTEMASGAPNTAETIRARVLLELDGNDEVPLEILRTLGKEREELVVREVESLAGSYHRLRGDENKLSEFLQHAREDVHLDPDTPIRFRPRPEAMVEVVYADKTSEIVSLAKELIRIPSVTASPNERIDEVRRAGIFIYDYLRNYGMGVRYYNRSKYPAILAGFPGNMNAPVMLCGHFDVVEPDPDDTQFIPSVDGDYLSGRGSADMKTVVATYLVWMKDSFRRGGEYPPVNLLLVGNEENGEIDPMGTPHVLNILADEEKYQPDLLIAGERTGERGDELWGEICTQNRGVMRLDVLVRGEKGHSGVAGTKLDLTERLLSARAALIGIFGRHLTLSSSDGWQSQVRYPFIQVGTPGVFNITADSGVIGVEVRPIPEDDIDSLTDELRSYCDSQGLEMVITVKESGIRCDSGNPMLQTLMEAVRTCSGDQPRIGRKLPGTSARFAPAGQGVVWGQTGIGPHSKGERHYIPSIKPYYDALEMFGKLLTNGRLT